MGVVDALSRRYFADKRRFADLFNCYVYKGRQVVKADALQSLETSEVASTEAGVELLEQRERDVLKTWQTMFDGETIYVVMGIETQSYMHVGMAARCMLYDAMDYVDQLEHLAREHRRHAREGHPDPGVEFLSGLASGDRISPVITLVVYLSPNEWDGPRSLYELLDVADDTVLAYVPDYRMNLFEPARMDDAELAALQTELGALFTYIKHSKDKHELRRVVQSSEAYRQLDCETAQLINAVTNSRIEIHEGEERVDMCKAIDDMLADSKAEGKAETLASLVLDGTITLEKAAGMMGLSPQEMADLVSQVERAAEAA